MRSAAWGLVVLVLAACADPGPAIRVEQAWARPTAASAPGAVYLSVRNSGDRPDRLIGVRSSRCAAVEIHESRVRDGRMSMVPVEGGIAVEPGTTVALEPGGFHVMLIGLEKPLSAGEHFEIALDFERSGEVTAEVEVRRR